MDNIATEIIKELKSQSKRWFIGFIVVISLWFVTIGGFVWFISQYDFNTIIDEAKVNNGGNACVGNNCYNGDIN
ncbi:MAG: hypothetical protein RRY22_04930 [Bacilli bacterium]